MKQQLFILPLLLVLHVFSCSNNEIHNDEISQERIVSENAGINLLEEPYLKSKTLAVIPYGTKLKPLSEISYASEIKELNWYWLQVIYKNQKGWVLSSGLLSKEYFLEKVREDKYKKIIKSFIQNPYVHNYNFQSRTNKRNSMLQYLISQFGKPSKQINHKGEIEHSAGVIIDCIDICFLNNRFYIVQTRDFSKQFLRNIYILNDKIKLKYGINFKKSKDDIIKIFGEPVTNENDTLAFSSDPDSITFEFKNDKIKNITIDYYVD
ncbi:MAG: SH3 domain-containing protein [Spirochaetota bacterium]